MFPMRNLLFICIFLVLFGCSKPSATPAAEITVYTHRHYPADQALFDAFSRESGITVNVLKAKADELIKRLEIEGAESAADVLITVDAGRLVRAKEKGLLQAVQSDTISERIPAAMQDPDSQWFALTKRARVLVYAKDRVDVATLSSYESLMDEQWRGRILVRSSQNIYNQSLLASITHHHGGEAAEAWAKAVVANMARTPKGNDRDQIRAVAAGKGDLAIVNTYYLGLLLNADDPADQALAGHMGVFFPNQGDRGTHINVSGIGVTAHAPNREGAIKLIEFLARKDSQEVFAQSNYEYPVNPQAQAGEFLQSWGEFKSDTVPLTLLGELNTEAGQTFDRAGWR